MSHISYPESHMNVAVLIDDHTVKLYGWEDKGFRKLVRTVQCDSRPQATTYVNSYNDAQKRALATRPGHGH